MTHDPGSAAPAERASAWSLRTRIMAALVSSLALTLGVAGALAWSLESGRLRDELDAHLRQRHAEVTAVAARGTDPLTGQRLTDVEMLLRSLMQASLPEPTEGEMGLIDGGVALIAPESVRVRPENDPAIVQSARASTGSQISTVEGTDSEYRYVAIPVSVPGDPRRALLVTAYDLSAQRQQLNDNFRSYAWAGLGSALLVSLLTWLLLGRLLRPIDWVRRTAQQISDEDLSRRIPVRGNDDLAALTRTINAMLDRLEGTFAAQRQLHDDVGHELRTPLTVMRGHLELMDAADPTDVGQTRALALSEIDRMAGLVEDLITLAKAERPDFVSPAPVAVDELTAEILDKARALGDRRWVLDELADTEAVLDERRVTQAMLELARNAVKFSAAGSTVGVGSAVEDGRVRLWVRDEGRGIARGDLGAVRERFGRVDNAVEGSGLGLSIVSSIARAHHGRLDIDSTPGRGSTFVLDLPRGGRNDDLTPLPPAPERGEHR